MSAESLAGQMRTAAGAFLARLDGSQRELAARPFGDDAARRWLEYRPRSRPGACIAGLSGTARKAAYRLLATGLNEHAYAQALSIIALEEVLDRQEQWRRGRHIGDYWVSVYGAPDGDQPWSWRFEGHHLSVTMTVAGEEVSPAPVFFGANPACVSYAGRPVSRPLGPEEDLVRELLDAMGSQGRSAAVVASQPPADIRSGTSPRASQDIAPLGAPAAPAPRITSTFTYQQGEMVYFELVYSDPGHNATGFGFVGVDGSDWPEQYHSFSNPADGIVETNSISYPLNQECGTGLEYFSTVRAWIYDSAGNRSKPVTIRLTCTT